MRYVLNDVSYRYTLDDEEPIVLNFPSDRWQKRERKHSSKKLRSLTNKVFFKDKLERN